MIVLLFPGGFLKATLNIGPSILSWLLLLISGLLSRMRHSAYSLPLDQQDPLSYGIRTVLITVPSHQSFQATGSVITAFSVPSPLSVNTPQPSKQLQPIISFFPVSLWGYLVYRFGRIRSLLYITQKVQLPYTTRDIARAPQRGSSCRHSSFLIIPQAWEQAPQGSVYGTTPVNIQ